MTPAPVPRKRPRKTIKARIEPAKLVATLVDRGIAPTQAKRGARALLASLDGRTSASTPAREERDAARAHTDRLIVERNLLLSLLTQQYETHLVRLTDDPKNLLPWSICMHTPEGKLAWRVSDEDRAQRFRHVDEAPSDWERHTQDEKRAKLEALVGALR